MALMAEKRFDATKIHTHTFALADLPTALKYARERIDDAIKVVVTTRQTDAMTRRRSKEPECAAIRRWRPGCVLSHSRIDHQPDREPYR